MTRCTASAARSRRSRRARAHVRHAWPRLLHDFPQLEGLRFSHRWGGAIDTCSRFSVFSAPPIAAAWPMPSDTRPGRRRHAVRRPGGAGPARRAAHRGDGEPLRAEKAGAVPPSRCAPRSSHSPAIGWRPPIGARAGAAVARAARSPRARLRQLSATQLRSARGAHRRRWRGYRPGPDGNHHLGGNAGQQPRGRRRSVPCGGCRWPRR